MHTVVLVVHLKRGGTLSTLITIHRERVNVLLVPKVHLRLLCTHSH